MTAPSYALATEWRLFRDRVLVIPNAQLEEQFRWCFFAGAASFYSLVLHSNEPAATAKDLSSELMEFAEYIRQKTEGDFAEFVRQKATKP